MYQDRFDRRVENLQFGESADGRSPVFVKGVNCCPCLGFYTLDVMLWVSLGSEIYKILYFVVGLCKIRYI